MISSAQIGRFCKIYKQANEDISKKFINFDVKPPFSGKSRMKNNVYKTTQTYLDVKKKNGKRNQRDRRKMIKQKTKIS